MINPIQHKTGSEQLNAPWAHIVFIVSALLLSVFVWIGGLTAVAGLIFIPFALFFLNRLFTYPKIGVYSVIFMGFTANGLSKYISGIPFGLTIDGLLVMTYIAIFFRYFYRKFDWSPAANSLTLMAVIWFSYSVFQLFNPEAQSKIAWFYAVRGVSLYFVLMIPLCLVLLNTNKELNFFFKFWGVFAILATLKGMMQLYIGVDPWEQKWLDAGAASTHILWGKLRVFSFYSDAGQFGAAQAHAGVVGTILFLNVREKKEKIFFAVMAIAGFYGMFISGTRGAMAVPFTGFFLYFILTRNVKVVVLGILMAIGAFVFFKYTSIGSGVYAIQRMRTAFNPDDPSLQVRLANQRRLKAYLASRPLGGGIGSAGYWGSRFSPHTFLAQVPTDSWYVRIWAEEGIIGLSLHIFILAYILGMGSYLAMFKVRDSVLQAKMFALASGMFGIMVASYGNQVLGQIPTGTLIYTSMAFLFLSEKLDKELTNEKSIAKES